MDTEDFVEESQRHIKKMYEPQNVRRLEQSLKGREGLELVDNPFDKLRGTYEVDIDMTGAARTKTVEIQRMISDAISRESPELMFTVKPGDTSHIEILDPDTMKTSRKKISRLIKRYPSDKKQYILNLMTRFPKRGKSEKTKIVITDDPVDVLRKSSSRSWAHQSCERLGAGFDDGPFSDIEYRNAVAYLYTGDNAEPAGRVMLRWCLADGRVDVGVEPVMYPRDQPFFFDFYDALGGILEEHGYGDYKKCKTPYEYKGYSDQTRGRGKIEYLRTGSRGLVDYARDPNLAINVAKTLARSPDGDVRATLAENHSICQWPEVIKLLAADTDPQIVEHVISTCGINELQFDQLLRLIDNPLPDEGVENWNSRIRIAIANALGKE